MALGATIYKVQLNVADTDRQYYASHALILARHPSETAKRLMVRLIAFAMHANGELAFTKGIAHADEPDLWQKDLTGAIDLWVEVGQPSDSRLLKACGRATQVVVYCFAGHASEVWWKDVGRKLSRVKNLTVVCLPSESVDALADLVQRNMSLHVNIQERELYIPVDEGQCVLVPQIWHQAETAS